MNDSISEASCVIHTDSIAASRLRLRSASARSPAVVSSILAIAPVVLRNRDRDEARIEQLAQDARNRGGGTLAPPCKHRGHESPRADFLHHAPLLDGDAGIRGEGIAAALEDIHQYRELFDRIMDTARLGDGRSWRVWRLLSLERLLTEVKYLSNAADLVACDALKIYRMVINLAIELPLQFVQAAYHHVLTFEDRELVMASDLIERIRARAYEIWEGNGREGNSEEHWLAAEREVLGDDAAPRESFSGEAAGREATRPTITTSGNSAKAAASAKK